MSLWSHLIWLLPLISLVAVVKLLTGKFILWRPWFLWPVAIITVILIAVLVPWSETNLHPSTFFNSEKLLIFGGIIFLSLGLYWLKTGKLKIFSMKFYLFSGFLILLMVVPVWAQAWHRTYVEHVERALSQKSDEWTGKFMPDPRNKYWEASPGCQLFWRSDEEIKEGPTVKIINRSMLNPGETFTVSLTNQPGGTQAVGKWIWERGRDGHFVMGDVVSIPLGKDAIHAAPFTGTLYGLPEYGLPEPDDTRMDGEPKASVKTTTLLFTFIPDDREEAIRNRPRPK